MEKEVLGGLLKTVNEELVEKMDTLESAGLVFKRESGELGLALAGYGSTLYGLLEVIQHSLVSLQAQGYLDGSQGQDVFESLLGSVHETVGVDEKKEQHTEFHYAIDNLDASLLDFDGAIVDNGADGVSNEISIVKNVPKSVGNLTQEEKEEFLGSLKKVLGYLGSLEEKEGK